MPIKGGKFYFVDDVEERSGEHESNCTSPSSKFVVNDGTVYFIDFSSEEKSTSWDEVLDVEGLEGLRAYARDNYDRVLDVGNWTMAGAWMRRLWLSRA